MKWATGMLSELNNHSLRLSYIPWNGEKLDTYWLHNISSRLIKSIANSKSFIFICRSSWIHAEFTYYICALTPCQHRQCLESEVHISTFMPSLQATGSSLMPCPHQYRDQQSTSIFHLLWLPPHLPIHFSTRWLLISWVSGYTYRKEVMVSGSLIRIPKGFHQHLSWDESPETHSYHVRK